MSDRTSFCPVTAQACWLLRAVMVLVVAHMCYVAPAARAQGTLTNKGDYHAPSKRSGRQSVIPKSIYLTPKSDRLTDAKPESPVATTRKGNRQHISPTDDEPWVAEPEEATGSINGEATTDPIPEITVPFDPRVKAPSKARKVLPRKKRKQRKARKRPIDVAMNNGRLKLNRFQTLTMDMPHSECRKFPDIFIIDYDMPRAAIDVLSDNMLIVQKRICAENGAVMVTCYQNNATISMRPAKPNDGCKR
ncbi:MAG: hypothetical protein HKN11_07385 [Rhizobiales bacterium]|nr:hypothetical protein [Hyphomicrobiales bacterium]